MAVYTEVGAAQVHALLARLALPPLTRLQGIAAGIENTNYFVDTEGPSFVLTLFERIGAEQLPYYLHLMKHLASAGIPVPEPQVDASGELVFEVAGKPAALLTRLPGTHRLAPDLHHCEQVASMLARLHMAGASFTRAQVHPRGLPWWKETVPVVLPHVKPAQARLLEDELGYQCGVHESEAGRALPRGPVHADLFRDNVLFDGLTGHEKLTGLLDFFFAGTDTWLFDVAVCLNDWCTDPDSGRLDEQRAAAFAEAYARVRPWQAAECRLMPAMLRAAAFRFWLSRLWDLHLPRDASLLAAHDPDHFERVLRERIATPWHPTH